MQPARLSFRSLNSHLFLALAFCGSVFAQDSLMFRNDLAHTGIYTGDLRTLHHVRWKFETKGEVNSSPAVAGGVVYVGSNDGHLYAIDEKTGAKRWSFATRARIPSSPAVANGLVYFGSYDGFFYAVDAATGTLKWKFANPGERRYTAAHLHGSLPAGETMPDPFDVYLSSPAIWQGAVYFGSGDGNIYALDAASGAVRWTFKTGDVVHASPAIVDGKLFIGSWDSYFYALDAATGKELWRFKTGVDPYIHNQVGIQSSATVADGVVYFGCRDSNFYALDAATGEKRWSFNNKGSWVIVSPVVSKGKVYFSTSDSAILHILDAKTGAPIDSVQFHWPMFASPALSESVLYVASHDGQLVALDLATRKPLWTFQSDGAKKNLAALSKSDGSPNYEAVFKSDFYDDMIVGVEKTHAVGTMLASPVVSGGMVFIGSADGHLYALE
ncbi:MAG TPA: PQQ-binding-like beta-propeller repeat protein [Terracidiphilus sp.]|jgi:outer membrane protein assembly factor BamB|nr:PQQ-binding-like beta-propeller repeat protein [Terracidiphilus sp.]